MINQIHQETLKQFREELYAEGILHDGDTIGTSDDTLLYVNNRPTISFIRAISKTRCLMLGGFYERADSTWPNPRKCLRIANNGARL